MFYGIKKGDEKERNFKLSRQKKIKKRPLLFSTQSSWRDIAYQQDVLVKKISHTYIIDENKHITDIYVTYIGIMVVQTC